MANADPPATPPPVVDKLFLFTDLETNIPNLPVVFGNLYEVQSTKGKNIPLVINPMNKIMYEHKCYGNLLAEIARLLEQADEDDVQTTIMVTGTKHIGKSAFYSWVLQNLHLVYT